MMKKSIFAFLFFLALFGCSSEKHQPNNNQIDQCLSIIGTWHCNTEKGILIEEWIRKNDSAFYGKSYHVQNNDTVLLETIDLIQAQDSIFYIPTVQDQNGGKPVKFWMTFGSSKKMVFENPNHDFPQNITYQRIGEDSLTALVSGVINGKNHIEKFLFKKMK